MGATANLLGLERTFEFDGETHTLHPMTYLRLGYFATWLEDRAWGVIERAKRFLSADDWSERADRLTVQIASGEFEPGSAAFNTATRSVAGQKKLVHIMLVDQPEELVDRLFADINTRNKVLQLAKEMNSDPKAKAAMMG